MKQLSEMNLMELKSLAYDLIVAQNKIQLELGNVQNEIRKRNIEENNKKLIEKKE